MSRRRFMARTSATIGELVTQLALEPSERADVQARMARYNRDCGCAMGAVFMVAALLTSAVYIVVTARFAIGVIGAGIGVRHRQLDCWVRPSGWLLPRSDSGCSGARCPGVPVVRAGESHVYVH